MKGALATAFAQMISALWSGTYQSFPPTKIKVVRVQWHTSVYSVITCRHLHPGSVIHTLAVCKLFAYLNYSQLVTEV